MASQSFVTKVTGTSAAKTPQFYQILSARMTTCVIVAHLG